MCNTNQLYEPKVKCPEQRIDCRDLTNHSMVLSPQSNTRATHTADVEPLEMMALASTRFQYARCKAEAREEGVRSLTKIKDVLEEHDSSLAEFADGGQEIRSINAAIAAEAVGSIQARVIFMVRFRAWKKTSQRPTQVSCSLRSPRDSVSSSAVTVSVPNHIIVDCHHSS